MELLDHDVKAMSLPTVNQDISFIELKTKLQRQSNFLRPLVISLIVLYTLGLLIMLLVPPISPWYSFVYVGLGLILNLGVVYLNRVGRIPFAANLFCYSLNAIICVMLLINLFVEKDPASAILMGYALALSILLAGMLINLRAIFWFTVFNVTFLFISILLASETLVDTLSKSFPIITFLCILAVVAWLYQKTMNKANAELGAAQQQLAHTELMKHDLAIARELQLRLYPNPPETGLNFTIACRSEPSQETSGDFYDFIQLGSHEWGLVVGDVTGKSLPAAMVMAMARSTLRSESNHSVSPSMLLRRANQVLCRDTAVDQMITVLYGVLNTEALTFHFANAGHIYPLLKTGEGAYELELNGFPLNANPQAQYQEKAIQLAPGDQLILSSDGIVETMNLNREIFGFERLVATACQADCATPAQTLQHIWQTVEAYRGPFPQEDDITLVVIGVNHHAQTPTNDEIDLETEETFDD